MGSIIHRHPMAEKGRDLLDAAGYDVNVSDSEMNVVAIAETLKAANPDINLNIEIHSKWAPFTLDIFDDNFFNTHVSPLGEGLAWSKENLSHLFSE